VSKTKNQSTLLADYLDFETLARELNVTTKTLWRWNKRKTGPPMTRIGHAIYYNRKALQEWLASLGQDPGPRRRRKAVRG
jgi:predicted DNA-binding transcriptional regulator AlpA